MTIARKLLTAAIVCAFISPGGHAAAQPAPPSTIAQPPTTTPRQRRPSTVQPDSGQSGLEADRYDPRGSLPEADEYDPGDADRYDPRSRRPRADAPLPGGGRTDPGARAPRDSRSNAGNRDTRDQARSLQDALVRYREIERRGGWRKLPTDLVMGAPYSYDCRRIEAIERRLMVEGYLERVSTPPPAPPPPLAQPEKGKKRPPAPPPPPVDPLCKYGPALTEAMRAFQVARKVKGEGQLGGLTLAELNRPVSEIVDILERDVERWRRVSLHPSGTYLLVNIPFFELVAYEDGRDVLRMRVITGQPSWQTPLFSDEIEHIIVNPDWGIPDSIAKQETLPLARRDPGYFRREGITQSSGGLRQKPGPRNPLGRIKFMMPNTHNVYLHDTPHKDAFEYPSRSFSHGCIRLGQPVDLANYLLRDDPQWNPSRLQTAIASKNTQQINLRRHMPVHIVYSTSRVNEQGHVELRPDVYGLNGKRAPDDSEGPRPGDDVLDTGP